MKVKYLGEHDVEVCVFGKAIIWRPGETQEFNDGFAAELLRKYGNEFANADSIVKKMMGAVANKAVEGGKDK